MGGGEGGGKPPEHCTYGNTYPPTRSNIGARSRCSHTLPSRLPKGRQRKGELTESRVCQQSTGKRSAAMAAGSHDSYLHKAQRQEGHVVGTEEGIEENLFDSAVEVGFQALHLIANEVWGQGAAVSRDGHRVVELFFETFSQQRQKVFGLDKAASP